MLSPVSGQPSPSPLSLREPWQRGYGWPGGLAAVSSTTWALFLEGVH